MMELASWFDCDKYGTLLASLFENYITREKVYLKSHLIAPKTDLKGKTEITEDFNL